MNPDHRVNHKVFSEFKSVSCFIFLRTGLRNSYLETSEAACNWLLNFVLRNHWVSGCVLEWHLLQSQLMVKCLWHFKCCR